MASAGYVGTSQNGWGVWDDDHFRDHAVRTSVAGVGFWSANDDVAVVLDDFTLWFHEEIESLNLVVKEAPGYDDWSRALRPVRGQTKGYSNHASCTARDLNSTRHPRGVSGTFTSAQRKKIRDKVNSDLYLVGGISVIRSGEFYSSTIDGMHFEINAGATAVKIVADRIRARKDELDMKEAEVRTLFREELNTWATTKKFIPNVAPGEKEATSAFTLAGFGQLSDQKADRNNDKTNAQNVELSKLQAAVAKVQAEMADLDAKLDAILAAVTPKGA